MAKYKALRDTWLSHECRVVKAGEEFEASFPEHMKLGDNLEAVKAEEAKPAEKSKGEKSKG